MPAIDEINALFDEGGLPVGMPPPPFVQAPVTTAPVPEIEDPEEEKRRKREEELEKYIAETPEKRAQRKMEELFGKKGERTGRQKANIFAEIVRTLGQGGPTARQRARAEAEQEYAKIAPAMQRELATASAERRAAEARKNAQEMLQDRLETQERLKMVDAALAIGKMGLARELADKKMPLQQAQQKLAEARTDYVSGAQTKLTEAQTGKVEQETKLGGSEYVQAHRATQALTGLSPDSPEYWPAFYENVGKMEAEKKKGKHPPSQVIFSSRDIKNIAEAKAKGLDLTGVPQKALPGVVASLIEGNAITVSQKNRDEISDITKGQLAFSKLFDLADKLIVGEGPSARMLGTGQKIAGAVGLNPDAKRLSDELAAQRPLFARMMGERGNLTEQEQEKALQALPRLGMTRSELDLANKRFHALMSSLVKTKVRNSNRMFKGNFQGFSDKKLVEIFAQKNGMSYEDAREKAEDDGWIVVE